MKRIRTLILCLMVLITAGCFSGCMFMGGGVDEDGNPQYEEIEGLAGIKACYKPSEYDFGQYDKLNDSKSYVEMFSENLLNDLFYIYGIPVYDQHADENSNQDKSTKLWKEINTKTGISHEAENSKYFERIRYETAKTTSPIYVEDGSSLQKYAFVENKGKAWNWSLGMARLDSIFTIYESKHVGDIVDEHNVPQNNGNQYENYLFLYKHFGATNDITNLKELYNQSAMEAIYNDIYDLYIEAFQKAYSVPLQINLYEIALGRAPSKFKVEYIQATGLPKITLGSEVIFDGVDGSGNHNVTLNYIKNIYSKNSSYVGFTPDAVANIKNLLRTNVIGENALRLNASPDYNVNYDEVLDIIISNAGASVYTTGYTEGDSSTGEEGGNIFNPFPASVIKDYPAASFFLSPGEDPFEFIPTGEYQSLVIMPDRKDEIMSIWLALKYDAGEDGDEVGVEGLNLDLTIKMRYWDAEAKQMYILNEQEISVPDGYYEPMGGNHTVMMDCQIDNQQVYAGIDLFDNDIGNGAISAPDENGKVISGIRPGIGVPIARDFYKLEASKNGYGGVGVLNNEKFEFSYIEIMFDVKKDPYAVDRNYNFKVGICGYYQNPVFDRESA